MSDVEAQSSAKADSPTTKPRSGSQTEIIVRVKNLLKARGVRLTYITVKRELLKTFTESSFNRSKRAVQTVLEEYHKRQTPVRPKKRVLSPRDQKSSAEKTAPGKKQEHGTKKQRAAKKKNPRLYFYEMNDDADEHAEGNRFISDNDL